MKKSMYFIVVFVVMLFSCKNHIFSPPITDNTAKVSLSVSFKVPQYTSSGRSNLPIMERFIHPQTQKITLVITEGETAIINTSQVIEEQSQTATFVLENIPVGKPLKLAVKAFDAEEKLVASGVKNFTLEQGQTSLSITLLPDGAVELDFVEDSYSYKFSQFQKDSYYMFLIENMPKGIYNFIWLSNPEDESFDGYDVPEVYILNENGNKHGEGALFAIETGSEADKFQWNLFGTTEDQDIYLFIKGKNLEDDELPSFEIWPYDGSVAVTGTDNSGEYIELLEDGAEIYFKELEESHLITVYNPYENAITITDIYVNYGESFPQNAYTVSDLLSSEIASGDSKDITITFDPEDGIFAGTSASLIIAFDTGITKIIDMNIEMDPLCTFIKLNDDDGYYYSFEYEEEYMPDGVVFEDNQFYLFKLNSLEKGVHKISWSNIQTLTKMELYTAAGYKHTALTEIVEFNWEEDDTSHTVHYFGIMESQDMYLLVKGVSTENQIPSVIIESYGDSILFIDVMESDDYLSQYGIKNNQNLEFSMRVSASKIQSIYHLYNVYETPITFKNYDLTHEVGEGFSISFNPPNQDAILPKGEHPSDFIILFTKEEGTSKWCNASLSLNFNELPPLALSLEGVTSGD